MNCAANYSETAGHTPLVQILWTRDGELLVSHASCGDKNTEVGPGESIHCISESTENLNSSLYISLQQFGGAGVYQCIFIINDTETEIVTTRPLRIDTGTCIIVIMQSMIMNSHNNYNTCIHRPVLTSKYKYGVS